MTGTLQKGCTALLLAFVALPAAGQQTMIRQAPGAAVASGHPLATQAGIEILEAGGNAFDAAVAVTAALAVVEPHGAGLGGGGFFLLHRPVNNLSVFVDGRETAPDAATGDMYLDRDGRPVASMSHDGPLGAAIPGTPAAMEHIARAFGRKPLQESLAPAIRYARHGFALNQQHAERIAASADRLSPAARDVFLPDGKPPSAGDRLVQPDLARTLESIAQRGARHGFYSGDVARRLYAGVFADGGIWSVADLERYRAREREPMVFEYRGHRITTAPMPSAGGVAMAQILGMLAAREWPSTDEHAARHELVEAMRLAARDRVVYLGDAGYVEVPVARLTGETYLGEQARAIGDAARPSGSLGLGRIHQEVARGEGSETTHFSIIDRDGNRVSGTLTLNSPFGSGYMPPGTGVLLNNGMDAFATAPLVRNANGAIQTEANRIQPHKRPLSSMAPTFVDGPRGVFITGTPGGSRTASVVLLSVLGHINGMNVQQAVTAPRFHHQFLPDEIQFEDGALTAEQQAALRERGHRLHRTHRPFGDVQAIHWDVAGSTLQAASDPRGGGAAVVRLGIKSPTER